MRFLLFTFSLFFYLQSFPQDTFSIIAVDPETGEVGAAGATCLFNQNEGIIDIISSIIPGKGGIMSQAYVCVPNINLQNGINQMNNGLSPNQIIDWFIENDQCSAGTVEYRQYGIIDIDENGEVRTAGYTGSFADNYKEDRQGPTYSIQGNILLDQSVINNMENNFNNNDGSLAEKLMFAMQGANFAGADSRCLSYGTSSSTAFIIVYQPDDIAGQPSLELNVGSQDIGVEPINILQNMLDNYLSLENNNINELIKLFPNPSDGIVQLSPENHYKIDVYDGFGKLVLSTTGNSFNIKSLDKGNYIIRLASTNLNSVFTYKILRK
tara:strand:+ start:247 stop:1218 length:972 start_codon:yes stop_codon:yes gene_type:complete